MDVFTAMSIFTGYDGLGLGLKQAIPNLRTICYVEREIFPVCNLVAKIKENKLDDAPIWDDITTFDGKPFAGLVDILHAGIPCQPWSNAGKQKGVKDERWIWADVFRIIVEVKPKYIFLGEVPGFVRGGGLGYVLSDLAQAGFNAEWGCFTAAEVGSPHKRERLFILAWCGRHLHGEPQEQSTKGGVNAQCDTAASGEEELANPSSDRPQGFRADRNRQGQAGLCDREGYHKTPWPARPGQDQYDWEEPRAVESGMGRAVDGFKSRVDELRLLGNGIVPDQAEKAIRYLFKKVGLT